MLALSSFSLFGTENNVDLRWESCFCHRTRKLGHEQKQRAVLSVRLSLLYFHKLARFTLTSHFIPSSYFFFACADSSCCSIVLPRRIYFVADDGDNDDEVLMVTIVEVSLETTSGNQKLISLRYDLFKNTNNSFIQAFHCDSLH